MNDQLNANDLSDDLPTGLDELTILKQRAKSLGVTHSNNIGVDALREKIRQKLEGEEVEDDIEEQEEVEQPLPTEPAPQANLAAQVVLGQTTAPVSTKVEVTMTARQKLIKEATKLVRCRIVCLNPSKKEWPGEFITVANEYIGTHKHYVPFGDAGQSYHLPQVIVDLLKDRKYNHVRTFKDPNNSRKIKVEERWTSEFSITELPPLTEDELAALRKAQDASGRVDLQD